MMIIGMKEEDAEGWINDIETALGGVKLQESVDSIVAEASDGVIQFSAGIVYQDSRHHTIKLWAKDYSNPTQEQKESICQGHRKVLGVHFDGTIHLDGNVEDTIEPEDTALVQVGSAAKQPFNTIKGELTWKGRYRNDEELRCMAITAAQEATKCFAFQVASMLTSESRRPTSRSKRSLNSGPGS
jgi:hypothetical protein